MHTLLGTWVGGPHGTKVTIGVNTDGRGTAEWRTPDGKFGGCNGLMMEGCRRFKGSWFDGRESAEAASGFESDVRTFDMRLSSDGKSWSASFESEAGGGTWQGRKKEWKPRRKSGPSTGWYKNKESWERLTASKNKREWAEKARLAMLEDEEKVGREDKNGLMSDTMPLCVGAPYDDKLEHSARHTGRSFVSGGPKRGINGLFSVPPSLAIGDTYRDVTERARERRLKEIEINKKFGERRSFRPTGRGSRPLDDPTARGFLGEVSKETSKEEIQRRLKEEREKKAEVKRDVEVGPRNFTTNPTKKGTFGYTGTLLGHKTEQGKELLSYKPDPESDDAARRRKELEDSKAAVGDRPRFVSRVRVRPEGTFTPHQVVYEGGGLGPGGGATVTFRGSPSKSRKRPSSAPPTQRHVDENDDRHWHPPHAPKSGFFGSFERYPEHVPDPIPEAVYHSRDEEAKVWRPNRSGRPPSAVGPVLFSRRNVARGMRRLSAGGSAHDAARALLRVRKVQSAGRVRGGRR